MDEQYSFWKWAVIRGRSEPVRLGGGGHVQGISVDPVTYKPLLLLLLPLLLRLLLSFLQ